MIGVPGSWLTEDTQKISYLLFSRNTQERQIEYYLFLIESSNGKIPLRVGKLSFLNVPNINFHLLLFQCRGQGGSLYLF